MKVKHAIRWTLTLSVILSMVCGSCLPAQAAEPAVSGLWVGDSAEVTVPGEISGTGGTGTASVSIEGDAVVLTLDGFAYTGAGHPVTEGPGAAILYEGEAPLVVRLAGANSVAHTGGSEESRGIFSKSGLSIEGADGGELTAAGGEAGNGSIGIWSSGPITVKGGTVTALGGKSGTGVGVYCEGDLTIENGTLTARGGDGTNNSFGICNDGKLLISGGNVAAEGGTADAESRGIQNNGGSIAVTGGTVKAAAGTVTAKEGAKSCSSIGMQSNGDIAVSGGEVTANGGTASAGSDTDRNSYGIFAKNISLEGGTMTLTGGDGRNSFGAFLTGTLTAKGGKLNATGGDVNAEGEKTCFSSGLYCSAGIAVSGAEVRAVSGNSRDVSFGIVSGSGNVAVSGKDTQIAAVSGTAGKQGGGLSAGGDIAVTGGTVKAEGGSSETGNSYGISCNGSISFSGADTNVTAVAGNAGSWSTGILSEHDITVSGGTVNASSGTMKTAGSNRVYSDAISCSGSFTVSGGVVTAASGEATEAAQEDNWSDGIYAKEKIVVSGGTVTAAGGAAKGNSYGMFTRGAFTVSGGTLTASAESAGAGEKLAAEKAGLSVFRAGTDAESAQDTDPEAYQAAPAKYVHIAYQEPDLTTKFKDLNRSSWYHDAVEWALEQGVMVGVSDSSFAPGGTATRGTVVTMLWRMAGQPASSASATFTDVKPESWYADAVNWAAENGVVTGGNDGAFSPNAAVTREQLAAILYRYAQMQGKGFTGLWSFRLDYPDADRIHAYANEPLCWMTMNGIIGGMGDGTLSPRSNASRTQIATIFMRFAEKLAEQ